MGQGTSKEVARDVILRAREKLVSETMDETIRSALTEDTLQAVFEEVWRGQFDDDVTPAQRAIKQIVDDSIDSQEIGDHSEA